MITSKTLIVDFRSMLDTCPVCKKCNKEFLMLEYMYHYKTSSCYQSDTTDINKK